MIQAFTHGRETHSAAAGHTHIIKIGYNAGETANKARFGRAPGFLIFRNVVDQNGNYAVDIPAMTQIMAHNCSIDEQAMEGWKEASKTIGIKDGTVNVDNVRTAVAEVLKHGMKVAPGLLPTSINFFFSNDVAMGPHGWQFGSLWDSAFESYKVEGCKGLFCRGDGVFASRWQPDGTRQVISCNPWGKAGADQGDWCPYSIPDDKGRKSCKAKGTLVVTPFIRLNGEPRPVVGMHNATFAYSTSSERVILRTQQELIKTAERLGGKIAGIDAIINYGTENTLTPHHVGGNLTQVNRVQVKVNEWAVQRREREQVFSTMRAIADDNPKPKALLSMDDEPLGAPADMVEHWPGDEEPVEPEAVEVKAEPVDEPAGDDPWQVHRDHYLPALKAWCEKVGNEYDVPADEVMGLVSKEVTGRSIKKADVFFHFLNRDADRHAKAMEALEKIHQYAVIDNTVPDSVLEAAK